MIELLTKILILVTAAVGLYTVLVKNKAAGKPSGRPKSPFSDLADLATVFAFMLLPIAFMAGFSWLSSFVLRNDVEEANWAESGLVAELVERDSTHILESRSLTIARRIKNPSRRSEALETVIRSSLRSGAYGVALGAAATIDGPGQHDSAMERVIAHALQANRFDVVNAATAAISNPRKQAEQSEIAVAHIDSVLSTRRRNPSPVRGDSVGD